MEGKRLNFDAPLLSVRRFTAAMASSYSSSSSTPTSASSATGAERAPVAAGRPLTKRSSLPSYRPEWKTGLVQKPGVVPFVWEQTPGQPKDTPSSDLFAGARPLSAPKPPPGRILNEKMSEGSNTDPSTSDREEEGQKPVSGDCRADDDDLSGEISSTESFLMNCSTNGSPDATESTGKFSTDPEVRNFMMGRFLPAAQAMATGLPQSGARKLPAVPMREPARTVEKTNLRNGLQALPLSFHHRLNSVVPHYIQDGEEDDSSSEDDSDHLSLKSRGLLPQFCLKSSFFLLNPIPGMKIQSCPPPPRSGRNPTPRIKTLHRGPLVRTEDENSWEAVYNYKSGLEKHSQVEERSKLASESNRLTYWSDSQTYDGSSSIVTSPYKNENRRSPSLEEKGFLGVPKKESECCKTDVFSSFEKNDPHGDQQKNSDSISPAIDSTLYVYSIHTSENMNSKSRFIDATVDTKGMIDFPNKDSKLIVDCERMEQRLMLDSCGIDAMQCKHPEIVDQTNDNDFRKHGSNDGSLHFKVNDQEKSDVTLALSLLPPPLPKSPSESWLSRTLPSVSSRHPSPQSFLGIQFQPRKQSSRAVSTDFKRGNNANPPK